MSQGRACFSLCSHLTAIVLSSCQQVVLMIFTTVASISHCILLSGPSVNIAKIFLMTDTLKWDYETHYPSVLLRAKMMELRDKCVLFFIFKQSQQVKDSFPHPSTRLHSIFHQPVCKLISKVKCIWRPSFIYIQ